MNDYDYNSDGDIDSHEWYSKWCAIKHFTVDDYLSCKQTKNVLNNYWDDKFYNKMEQPILGLFNSYLYPSKQEKSNIFHNANETHGIILLELIRHHISKSYNLRIFKENPDLALPILNQYIDIKKKQKEKISNIRKEKFNDANKQFNWGK